VGRTDRSGSVASAVILPTVSVGFCCVVLEAEEVEEVVET
jgi:hypothetical protein